MIDKNCIQQILGCLMKRPQILAEVDKYSLNLSDFPTRFEKYIFSAIVNLEGKGSKTISPIDISNYLNTNAMAKDIMEKQNGLEYLQDILEISNLDSFSYYYDKLKKINLLNDLKKQGIDISRYYVEDILDPKAFEINGNFENLTIKDIVDDIKKRLVGIESRYGKTDEVQVENIADDIEEFIINLKEEVEVGIPIQGDIYNQVINGAERGALTIRSAGSGVGKTRCAVADACFLAFPIRYNSITQEWEQEGSNEKVLFIVTEQTFKQVRKMIIAYLTDINEGKFKYGDFTERELKIINQATEVIKKYKDNFTLIKIPNPTIELVNTLVRENVLLNDIGYVFYDYIFIGPSLLNEHRGFNLRNDKLLSYI